MLRLIGLLVVLLSVALAGCDSVSDDDQTVTMLNASYDPTRRMFSEIDQAFARSWMEQTQQRVLIRRSHGGSGAKARAVMEGLPADVVTLALGFDIDAIAERTGLIDPAWQSRFEANSAPYHSTLVFLVRRGNPKGIRDWRDLLREDVEVVTPNPKTSGVARWNYLALWGALLRDELGPQWLELLADPAQTATVGEARERVAEQVGGLFRRLRVMDRSSRAATHTFMQRGVGDVLINWENEILLSIEQTGSRDVELVVPALSILAEPVVAVVDRVVDRRQTREVAEAYLRFLYSEEGQQIIARHHFRPSVWRDAAERSSGFAEVEMFRLDEVFGSWREAHQEHFAEGGRFDRFFQR